DVRVVQVLHHIRFGSNASVERRLLRYLEDTALAFPLHGERNGSGAASKALQDTKAARELVILLGIAWMHSNLGLGGRQLFFNFVEQLEKLPDARRAVARIRVRRKLNQLLEFVRSAVHDSR